MPRRPYSISISVLDGFLSICYPVDKERSLLGKCNVRKTARDHARITRQGLSPVEVEDDMDYTTLISVIINAAAAIAVAAMARNIAHRNKRDDRREELRWEESRVTMQMLESTMELSTACCNALCGGHNNGNVEEARRKADAARADYQAYKTKVVSEVLR